MDTAEDRKDQVDAISYLLDQVRAKLNLKSDMALGIQLGLGPPCVSKLRSGRLPLGTTLLLRIHDSGLELSSIRDILGQDFYNRIVWKSRRDLPKGVFALLPMQQTIIDTAISDMDYSGYAVVKLGVRSGKSTVLAGFLNASSAYRHICFYGSQMSTILRDGLVHKQDGVDYRFKNMDIPTGIDPASVLVVLNEPFWEPQSHLIFNVARLRGYRIFVIGSNGPQYESTPLWKTLGGQSYNTWDVQPHITRESLESRYHDDPVRAARDFEAF